MLLHINYL